MIEWNLPGKDEAGHLRRRRELSTLTDAPPSVEAVDSIAEYLVQFVREPQERSKALDAVLDMPEREYQVVIARILGYILAPVPDPKGEPSATP